MCTVHGIRLQPWLLYPNRRRLYLLVNCS